MVLVAASIDFWNIVIFRNQELSSAGLQFLFYLSGTFILPFGLTLIVKSTFPAFVFDELMLMFVDILKAKKITYIRLTIEFIGISIGAIFGYLTYFQLDGSFGAVNFGSFVFAFTLSPIMAFFFKKLKVHQKSIFVSTSVPME